jgi:hypothetical protein
MLLSGTICNGLLSNDTKRRPRRGGALESIPSASASGATRVSPRYRRERWQLPDGSSRLAPLPADGLPGDHFGPVLQGGFVLDQYHGQRITQPLQAQVRP